MVDLYDSDDATQLDGVAHTGYLKVAAHWVL